MAEEWFEKPSFWENFAPVIFDEARWKEAPRVAEYLKALGGLEDGDSVLDAGCGIGRISVELALIGLKVTGVDIIESELQAARESAEDENLEIEFLNRDLRNLCIEDRFSLAVSVYSSFGYCESKEDDRKILEWIFRSLKKGGRFILECVSRETAILYFTEGEWFTRGDFTVLTEFSVEGLWEGLKNRWILIGKDGKRIEHEYVQRLYPASELKSLLEEIGFSCVKVYGDYDFSPYDHKARTMVIIAEK